MGRQGLRDRGPDPSRGAEARRGGRPGDRSGGVFAESGSAATAAKPKRGGTLRVALTGGSASADNLDPHARAARPSWGRRSARTSTRSSRTSCRRELRHAARRVDEPNHDATVWTSSSRRAITFHDGSELTVDDVIYTFKRILDPQRATTPGRGEHRHDRPQRHEEGQQARDDDEAHAAVVDLPSAVGQRYISIIKRGATGAVHASRTPTAPARSSSRRGRPATKLRAWSPTATTSSTASRTRRA